MPTKTSTKALLNYSKSLQHAGQDALSATVLPPTVSGSVSVSDTFTGAENRNWKQQVRSGANATTIANGVKIERTGTPMRFLSKGYVNGTTNLADARSSFLEQFMLPVVSPSVTALQEASVVNQARTKFSRSVERAMTQFSGGVFLAELRETLHMIRRPGQSLRKAVGQYLGAVQQNARRLKRRPKRDRERWLSNTWLEYSFGWAPLLNDLDDARNYLQARQDALLQELVPVKGYAKGRFLSNEIVRSFTAGVGSVLARERRVNEVTQVYAGAVSSRAYGPSLINASAMGLSPRSFVPTLWEIIPWSFVIDYFSNVGDVITGWSNQHTQLAWGRDTLIKSMVSDFIDQRGGTPLLTKVLERTLVASNQVMTVRTFSRIPISTPPVPGFSFEIPGMGVKWINIGALVASRRAISSLRLDR